MKDKVTIHTLKKLKHAGQKICMVTAYDATFARLIPCHPRNVPPAQYTTGAMCHGRNVPLAQCATGGLPASALFTRAG